VPINQPNRENNPVSLEANVYQAQFVSSDGEYVPWYNNTEDVVQMGEVFVSGGAVWLSMDTILPGTTGNRTCNFVIDLMLDPDHTGNISQDALVYIDTDNTDADNPLGYAVAAEPTNGFVAGRATVVSGASSLVVAATGSPRVRVRSSIGDFETFST